MQYIFALMPDAILIYTPQLSNRLDYICKFLFRDVLQVPFTFTTSIAKIENSTTTFINYSHTTLHNGLQIIPHTLLFEDGITPQQIDFNTWQGLPTFFSTNGSFIPFDLFSAAFYLVTRYEEYLSSNVDLYGRYPHTDSIAFKNNFLQEPLIDQWMQALYNLLLTHQCTPISNKQFASLFTYDVDMNYAYRNKPLWKQLGGIVKNAFNGNFKTATNRARVLFNKQAQDPFDVFDSIINKHKNTNTNALFFYLLTTDNHEYNKNNNRTSAIVTSTINKLVHNNYPVHIHPSYNTISNITLLQEEKTFLQSIINTEVKSSRQHYIRCSLPITYQNLIAAGITADYSMGYGSINGFRASTCTTHFWFNLSTNKSTLLKIHPFVWMDANSLYEQQYTAAQAIEEYTSYYTKIKQVNGTCISIWHNFIINKDAADWVETWKEIFNKK